MLIKSWTLTTQRMESVSAVVRTGFLRVVGLNLGLQRKRSGNYTKVGEAQSHTGIWKWRVCSMSRRQKEWRGWTDWEGLGGQVENVNFTLRKEAGAWSSENCIIPVKRDSLEQGGRKNGEERCSANFDVHRGHWVPGDTAGQNHQGIWLSCKSSSPRSAGAAAGLRTPF